MKLSASVEYTIEQLLSKFSRETEWFQNFHFFFFSLSKSPAHLIKISHIASKVNETFSRCSIQWITHVEYFFEANGVNLEFPFFFFFFLLSKSPAHLIKCSQIASKLNETFSRCSINCRTVVEFVFKSNGGELTFFHSSPLSSKKKSSSFNKISSDCNQTQRKFQQVFYSLWDSCWVSFQEKRSDFKISCFFFFLLSKSPAHLIKISQIASKLNETFSRCSIHQKTIVE